VFFTFAGGPAVFSEDMKSLLGPAYFPYFSGAIAQVLIARFFGLQLVCGGIALAHLVAEWLYLGRPLRRFTAYLLVVLLSLGLVGDLGMQPRIKQLHRAKYTSPSPQVRASAARSLAIWHGVAQGVNLLMLGGLVVYLWRMTNPPDATRFASARKLRS
jgi:predicted membrane protein